jgi:hypothetical protein
MLRGFSLFFAKIFYYSFIAPHYNQMGDGSGAVLLPDPWHSLMNGKKRINGRL